MGARVVLSVDKGQFPKAPGEVAKYAGYPASLRGILCILRTRKVNIDGYRSSKRSSGWSTGPASTVSRRDALAGIVTKVIRLAEPRGEVATSATTLVLLGAKVAASGGRPLADDASTPTT